MNIKLQNLKWRENDLLQSISRSAEQTKKSCIASKHSPYFLKLSKREGANRLIFQVKFPVFPCKWLILETCLSYKVSVKRQHTVSSLVEDACVSQVY